MPSEDGRNPAETAPEPAPGATASKAPGGPGTVPEGGAEEALRAPAEAFRSAVARAVDEVRGLLRRSAPGTDPRAVALGPFAAGRIDTDRYAALVSGPEPLDGPGRKWVERALEVLLEIDAGGGAVPSLVLEDGEDPVPAVRRALAASGRAFGAARTVELVRTGRHVPERHGDFLEAFGPERWNRQERALAPPLRVGLRGADLEAGGLAPFLEGAQKLLLVARGPVPPAALVRLVTPSVLVLQTDRPEELVRLGGTEGPAVGLLFERGVRAARFLHLPRGGPAPSPRLAVEAMPEAAEVTAVGAASAERLRDELAQLARLGAAGSAETAGEGAAANGGAPPAGEEERAADRLAAWLLRQADLREPG